MTYTPTTWVEGVTKLGPTNLNKIEQGIVSASVSRNVSDYADIQSAITAASSAGGGDVYVGPGTHSLSASVTLANDVRIVLDPGALVQWGGSAGGVMFTTSTTVPTRRTGVIGGRVDPVNAGYVFDLHSVQESEFAVGEILTGSTALVGMRMQADAAASTGGYESTKNSVFNDVRLVLAGQCGTAVTLSGTSSSQVVALNTFSLVEAQSAQYRGIQLVQWADTNVFEQVRVEMGASNSIGVVLNDTVTPTVEAGVYGNYFGSLAVDTFAGPTGRKGILFNKSHLNVVEMYANDPAAEGGSVVDPGYADSYEVRQLYPDGTVKNLVRGVSWVAGIPGTGPSMEFNSTTGFVVKTAGGTTAFSIKASDGTVTLPGPMVEQLGIYASNATDKLIDSTRKTGWTAPTGTPSRATYATGSVSVSTLAGFVMALYTDLAAHGLIGP